MGSGERSRLRRKEVGEVEKALKHKKRRKYIQPATIGVKTRVQWGKRGGPVRIPVLIPRELTDRLAKKR